MKTVIVTLKKWLCVSKGTADTKDWIVWESGWSTTKPPFAVQLSDEKIVTLYLEEKTLE
jgi:hypothetical protein